MFSTTTLSVPPASGLDNPPLPSGLKTKARDILAAIRTLKQIEAEQRPATEEERHILTRFGGFGAVALSLFPDPISGQYKDASWQALGDALREMLTPEEYDSARRTTFTAFYTSPVVMHALHAGLTRLGVPATATVLEPGCGIGNFMGHAPEGMRFIGVELDNLSGRMARLLHPQQDIRIENFRDTHLPPDRIDAVIGNVPFADVKLDFHGQRLSLHDYFLAKSLDALKPGGVLAVVVSHYTLDKQNSALRQHLAAQADFLGAIRLPAEAFKREGTSVVTDLVFLQKRAPGAAARHADPAWLETAPLTIEGVEIPVNRYFLTHPEMVLGTWTRQDRLYGSETNYSLQSTGDLATQLQAALARLPENIYAAQATVRDLPARPIPLPPLERHITEGSFFVADDQTLQQVQHGEAVAVRHGTTPLTATGTLLGKRLAALIELRDEARRVLQSQNEDWPVAQREQARKALNRAYDTFTSRYGAINKTTLSTTEDGTTIRRMPNLVKFRDDPDAMLVMALEAYDEATDTATKADIMRKDVVGRSAPVTAVGSAEEGLLVSLNTTGTLDLPTIARLYPTTEAQILDELGDLAYHDPATDTWQTADAYLSGNVRAKLQAAEQAGAAYRRNVEALQRVQPEDVLPGDIDANLGAPWIPESDVRDFAAMLFSVPATSVQVAHLKKDALWSVSGGFDLAASVAATTDYGTERAGGVGLLEQALNLKAPTIYDVIRHPDGSEERRVNQEETLAAREKQKRIKERFKAWLFENPERTERLVRLYNDTYNAIRLRAFDGAHLSFPGMNAHVTLYPHQQDAVWRVMSSGNTLLAHTVGAGKTNVMAAAGMKMKQTGLLKKPLYVVPNHMLEQFGREFMHLYPNAHLLIAGKEDFTKARRKLLTAKIASSDWDGIIVTHSSFERLGMSREFQARFLREQIAEYENLLEDAAREDTSHSRRNIIKSIEKQKAKREERLHDLLATDKKDDGLVFDELGVDHLFIDEAHYFKNLETPTKMERVAGIQTGGSERAFDLAMKCRYLDACHAGHGVTFATGTPVSNTMVELYTLQRYLDPRGLDERGLEHFDAWAATFGEVVDAMEIAPDGKTLKPRSRFAKFTNLPELQQMFRAFADVKTAEMLNLPRPALAGGKPTTIACPMSEAQRAIQDTLIARYEAIRSGLVKPWEDNALAITTDGRKLALDARLLDAQAADYPGSKLNALVDNVTAIWEKTAASRGTQLIFSDMGVHPTAWGYAVYQDVIDKLVQNGIPRAQIASIGDADTDAKKQVLFDKVRAGTVRILLGSTQKMGTGTNVQKRLVALHHLDAPWKPAEVEQRDGRILRQGNGNAEVAIYRYVTEGSFDAYMWQALETKARFIGQVMTGSSTARQAEDVGGQELSYAEVKALASGNPAVLTLAETDAEVQRLLALKKHHADAQYTARKHLKDLPVKIARLDKRLHALERDQATAAAHADDPITIGDRQGDKKQAIEWLGARLRTLPKLVTESRHFPLGVFRGLPFSLALYGYHSPEVCLEGEATRLGALARDPGPLAVLNAVERTVNAYAEEIAATRRDLELARTQLREYETRIGGRFTHEAYLSELMGLRNRLEAALSGDVDAGDTEEIVAHLHALHAAQPVPAAPERPLARPSASMEEAVTTRILKHRPVPSVAVEEEEAVETVPVPVVPEQTAEIVRFKTPMPQMQRPQPRPVRRAVADQRQMSLL